MIILKRVNGEEQPFNEQCQLDEVAMILTGPAQNVRFFASDGHELDLNQSFSQQGVHNDLVYVNF